MRVCFIVNPAAGSGGFQKLVVEAATYLSQRGCAVERLETQAKGDATRLAQQAAAEQFEVAVAVGGDGTINEVCNGLAGTETALGVLPAGTANVYAADMGIPIWWPLNPSAVNSAADVIVTGQCRRVDLGRVRLADGTQRYFLMWCGIGLDAAITQALKPGETRRLGMAAWVISGFMVAVDFMGTKANILTDEGLKRTRVLWAVISNGQLYGRIWRMAPEAKMDDGLLDVAIMTGYGWPSTVRHLAGLTLGQHVRDPDFSLHHTTHFALLSKEALPVHVDAEPLGTTPIEVEVVPLALKVIVPKSAPEQLFQRAAQ
jgi:YegS/Rv2252/BmrU family lipid kinase